MGINTYSFSPGSTCINNDVSSMSENQTKTTRTSFSNGSKPLFPVQSRANINEEGALMSFAYVCCHGDAIYFAADSRSTITLCSADKSNSNRRFEDNYQKIVVKEELNAVVVATGNNMFYGKTLSEVVKESSSIAEIADKISSASYYIAYKDGNSGYYFKSNNEVGVIKSDSFWYSGDSTVVSIIDKIPLIADGGDSEFLAFLNKIFLIATTVSELTSNTVGGKLHILKLTPDGFNWLQNEY